MEHMYKPVKWEQTMQTLYQRREGEGFPKTYEVGPGTQLGVILKMINRKAHESYTHIDVQMVATRYKDLNVYINICVSRKKVRISQLKSCCLKFALGADRIPDRMDCNNKYLSAWRLEGKCKQKQKFQTSHIVCDVFTRMSDWQDF